MCKCPVYNSLVVYMYFYTNDCSPYKNCDHPYSLLPIYSADNLINLWLEFLHLKHIYFPSLYFYKETYLFYNSMFGYKYSEIIHFIFYLLQYFFKTLMLCDIHIYIIQ